MERCAKRKQIDFVPMEHSLYFQKDETEEHISGDANLDDGLAEKRAKLDKKLKATFESIFEKYGRDFEGVGDEIDIATGEIVVNNGHVLRMQDEKDAGEAKYWRQYEDELENELLKTSYLSLPDNDASCDEDYPEQDTKQKNDPIGADSLYDQDEDDLILRGFVKANRFLKLPHEEIPPQPDVSFEGSTWNLASSRNMFLTGLPQNNHRPTRPETDLHSRFDENFPRYRARQENDIEPAWRVPNLPQLQKDPSFDSIRRNLASKSSSLHLDYPTFSETADSLWAPVKSSRRERFENENTGIQNGKKIGNRRKKMVKEARSCDSAARRNTKLSMQSSNTRVSRQEVSSLNWAPESLNHDQKELHVSEEVGSKNSEISSKLCVGVCIVKPVRELDNEQLGKKEKSTPLATCKASLPDVKYTQISDNLLANKFQIGQNCPPHKSPTQNNHESILKSANPNKTQEARNDANFELKITMLIEGNCAEVGDNSKMSPSHRCGSNQQGLSNACSKKEFATTDKPNQDTRKSNRSQFSSLRRTDEICSLDDRISGLKPPASFHAPSSGTELELNPNCTNKDQTTEDPDCLISSPFGAQALAPATSLMVPDSAAIGKGDLCMEKFSTSKAKPENHKASTASSSDPPAKATPCQAISSFGSKSCENVPSSACDPHKNPVPVQGKEGNPTLTHECAIGGKKLQEPELFSHQRNPQTLISVFAPPNNFSHDTRVLSIPTVSPEQNLGLYVPQGRPGSSVHSMTEVGVSRDRDLEALGAGKERTFGINSYPHAAVPEQASKTYLSETRVCSINPATCLQVDGGPSHFEAPHSRNPSAGNPGLYHLSSATKKEPDSPEIANLPTSHPLNKKSANSAPPKRSKVKNPHKDNIAPLTPATCSRLPVLTKGFLSSTILSGKLANSVDRKLFKSSLVSFPKSEEIDELSLDHPEHSSPSVFLRCIKNKGVVKLHKNAQGATGGDDGILAKSAERHEDGEDELSAEYKIEEKNKDA